MLVSTQRPSVNVVTGSIKANLPYRISFRLASKVDSRTILDMNGAESLLGRGDMLFLNINATKPIRAQSCFVSEGEIERIVDFIRQHAPDKEVEVSNPEEESEGETEPDSLYDDAVELVLKYRQASAAFIQQKMGITYERASQLIEIMEIQGIVGPSVGDQPREILVEQTTD